ncbi:MAG: chorismate synthase [Candidatus Saccharicenans sp.]|nr:MAG: chorismate synthase [Candidatus Aminicenantes bacterium]HEK86326.1 chorismate synthase [Candidatus Aminicenantes bacterium]
MLRYLTAGESHGKGLVGVLEGMVAGVRVDEENIAQELRQRRYHFGRSSRMRLEDEKFEILSGVRDGVTTGAPIAVYIQNRDVKELKDFVPRPGHADLAGCAKYGFKNIHLVAERASARETALRVALGAIAKNFLKEFKVRLVSHTVEIGGIRNKKSYLFEEIEKRRFDSPIYCLEDETEKEMLSLIKQAAAKGDSVGGVTEIRVKGLPVGLGSFVHYDRRLEYRIGGALLSIPAVKGIEVGEVKPFGSENNDPISLEKGKIKRSKNDAGGLEGGMSNGQELIIKLKVKPVPSLMYSVNSVNLRTLKVSKTPVLRADVCVVPAVGVVAENILAIEIGSLFLEKFGGDSLAEVKRNWQAYLEETREFNWSITE